MEHTTPAATVGVVGGGQLGRMMGEAASPLGVEVVVSDPTPDCPAAPVVRDQVVGDFDDYEAIRDLAERADVLTFEIELADPDEMERVGEETDTPVQPDPDTLRTIQDKLVQNRALEDAGVPVPEFRRVDDADDLLAAGEELGWPLMCKAREGGYDGRGNVPAHGPDEAEAVLDEIGGPALAEEMVDFERELAVMGVKGDGETRAFPVTETVHEEEILRELVTPARTDPEVHDRAREVVFDVLEMLDGRGVFGIELFETSEARSRSRDGDAVSRDDENRRFSDHASANASGERSDPRAGGEILVNEIAPRPHNSGHWTIEGARSSQFEQHVRAVLGWPLGSTERRAPSVTTNILGDVDEPEPAELSGVEAVLEARDASLHWYGKREVRPLRKMGHVTVVDDGADDVEALLFRARDLRDRLTFR